MKSQFVHLQGLIVAGALAGLAGAQTVQQNPPPAVQAQTPAPAQAPQAAAPPAATPPATQAGAVYVRRFSAGGMLSVMGLPGIPGRTVDQTVSTNVKVNSTTDADKRLFGGGVVVQFALTNRFAVTSDFLIRKASFKTTDITYEGVDDSSTTADERKKTTKESKSRATFSDIPILLRYYNKDRTKPGRRRFFEGGVTFRKVHGIHSFGQTTTSDGKVVCCDETPITPANKWLTGFTAGFGYQFIDDMKIRFIPEVRYTRWMGRTFDTLSTQSRVDQIEGTISITF